MNIEKIIPYILSIVIGAAAICKLDDLQIWIIKAQAKVLYESRSSNWGSPNVFKNTNGLSEVLPLK